MNVIRENIDKLNAQLKVHLGKEDYAERVEKTLREYRRKANIDGFRPGKVPFGLVNKLYGKPVKLDEINKAVAEAVSDFIDNEKLQILGEPMPNDELNKNIDWENQEDYDVTFDIALAPEFSVDLGKKLKIPYYTIKVDKDMIDKSVDDVARRYGKFTEVEQVENEEMLKGNLIAVDEAGNPLEKGASAEDVILSMTAVKDEEIKKMFTGKRVQDLVIFDLKKAFPLDADRIGMLRLDKKEVRKTEGLFSFQIKEVKAFSKSEINQELFDKVYGEGTVKSEEEFREKISGDLEKSLKNESEYRFSVDARQSLLAAVEIPLPSEFLKRWMLHTNEGKITQEQIDTEFPHFEEDLRWQLIMGKISKDSQITLSEEELKEYTALLTRAQFERYGMFSIPEEHLNNYVEEMLNKPEERRKISEKKLEEKIITFVKDTVKLDEKNVTTEEFNKLFEK